MAPLQFVTPNAAPSSRQAPIPPAMRWVILLTVWVVGLVIWVAYFLVLGLVLLKVFL